MNHFFAYMDRLKLIRRWGLMRNTVPENDMEHSMQAAMIAHGLAALARARFDRDVNPERVLSLALYHDAGEVITGDLPTPVKYKNPEIMTAYKKVEGLASEQLLSMLPDDLREGYRPYLQPDEGGYEWRLVKAADRICAYLKCVEEEKAGNQEFRLAKETIGRSIRELEGRMPEVQAFMDDFAPSYGMTLDELSRL